MICPKCGAVNDSGTLFCVKCAGKLNENAQNTKMIFDDENSNNEFDNTISMKAVKRLKAIKIYENEDSKNKGKIENISENAKKSGNNRGLIVTLLCFIGILICVLAFVSIKLALNGESKNKMVQTVSEKTENVENKTERIKKSEKSYDKGNDKSDEYDEETQSETVSFSTIPVDMTYSSSERTDGDYTYLASYVADSKLISAWSPVLTEAVGENITFCFSKEHSVHGIKISNGYSKSETDYLANARLKEFTVKFPDGTSYSASLADNTTSLQNIKFKEPVNCRSFTLYVDSVYSAENGFEPLYISEIEVY